MPIKRQATKTSAAPDPIFTTPNVTFESRPAQDEDEGPGDSTDFGRVGVSSGRWGGRSGGMGPKHGDDWIAPRFRWDDTNIFVDVMPSEGEDIAAEIAAAQAAMYPRC